MSNYFNKLPPELISLLSPFLSISSLNTLALTCHRFHEILQPELESRLTLDLGRKLLFWAAASKPHIVAKLLSPPHSIHPSGYGPYEKHPIHVAAEHGNIETATLLLEAGANPAVSWDWEFQALHLATKRRDLAMISLLLDHGAPVDQKFGIVTLSDTPLHLACEAGHLDAVELLLSRGASLRSEGGKGPALGIAVHLGHLDVVRCLLRHGANAEVTVPYFPLYLSRGYMPLLRPHYANLLYIAMMPRPNAPKDLPPWEGLLLDENRKQTMALLLAHGASKGAALKTVLEHLTGLAKTADLTEAAFLDMVESMLARAEEAVADVF